MQIIFLRFFLVYSVFFSSMITHAAVIEEAFPAEKPSTTGTPPAHDPKTPLPQKSTLLVPPPQTTIEYLPQKTQPLEDCIPDPLYLGSRSDQLLTRDLLHAEASRDTALQGLLNILDVGNKTISHLEILEQLDGVVQQKGIDVLSPTLREVYTKLNANRSDLAGNIRCLKADFRQNIFLTQYFPRYLKKFLDITAGIAVFMLVYFTAARYMIYGYDDQISSANKNIYNVIIGLIVIILARAIVGIIETLPLF